MLHEKSESFIVVVHILLENGIWVSTPFVTHQHTGDLIHSMVIFFVQWMYKISDIKVRTGVSVLLKIGSKLVSYCNTCISFKFQCVFVFN